MLQYKHRYWDDPVSEDFAAFQERCIPDYRRDTYSGFNGGYARADFETELREAGTFDAVTRLTIPWEQRATPADFRGYCYSMSHIKKAEERFGTAHVSDEVEQLISRHIRPDGHLIVGWITEITMANTRTLGI